MFTEEKGRLLENVVFIELRRRGLDVFYFSGKNECDFLIRQGTKIVQAIQVCFTFDSPETKTHEIKGLCEAMKSYSLENGLILTNDLTDNLSTDELNIQAIPVWKWLLTG